MQIDKRSEQRIENDEVVNVVMIDRNPFMLNVDTYNNTFVLKYRYITCNVDRDTYLTSSENSNKKYYNMNINEIHNFNQLFTIPIETKMVEITIYII